LEDTPRRSSASLDGAGFRALDAYSKIEELRLISETMQGHIPKSATEAARQDEVATAERIYMLFLQAVSQELIAAATALAEGDAIRD
jgi:hypothetical protein